MVNIGEYQKGANWYVFLVIGLLIGAILGYYVSEKGLLKQKSVGVRPSTCFANCERTASSNTCSGGSDYEGCMNTWVDRCNSACGTDYPKLY